LNIKGQKAAKAAFNIVQFRKYHSAEAGIQPLTPDSCQAGMVMALHFIVRGATGKRHGRFTK
jgi:hypothetical protein